MYQDYIVPETVTNELNYINTAYKALEDAFIKPGGSPVSSPFVKYVGQLLAEAPEDGKKTPVIMSKGFYYYLLDLKQGPSPEPNNYYYYKRCIFAQSKIFGSLTAFSHIVPALFAIKEINGTAEDLSYLKDALDGFLDSTTGKYNTGSAQDWKHDAWGADKGQILSGYMNTHIQNLHDKVQDWVKKDGIDDDSWLTFCRSIYKPMINTFFLALVSEADQLFKQIRSWKEDEELSEFNWCRVKGIIGFSSDNPLAGKPTSDFSENSAAEYLLMRAFMLKIFEVDESEFKYEGPYPNDSKATNFYSNRVYCFPTAIPGWSLTPNGEYAARPANPVDQTFYDPNKPDNNNILPENPGDTYKAPNSVIMGSPVASLYWSTIAQRNMAAEIFPDIESMTSDDEYPARAFYDILCRPQYGLRYRFVKDIADYYVKNGNLDAIGCPYPDGLW